METKSKIKVHLIHLDESVDNPLIINIVGSINSYLLRNKGAVSDFNLIKDIVERNCDAVDEEINQQLPVPIYLGLMGTILGIIIGLWSINFNPVDFMVSVSSLISSVKWAMGCSFVGLLTTTFLSAWLYRDAKAKLEAQKNELYTFIQIELLPQLSQDANSTILAMQAHLEKFNEGFSENVNGFDGIMNRILEAFDSQVKLTEQLQHMDIARVAHLNASVLVELRKSMTEFEKFNQYLNLMNSFVGKTAQLTDSVNHQLNHTKDVKMVVDGMQENIENNRIVMVMLQNFLEKVEAHSALLTSTASLDDALADAIGQLKQHVQDEINAIKQHTTEATQELDTLMHAERGHLDKLKNLDQLDKLVKAMDSMKSSYDSQNSNLTSQVAKLSQSISQMKGNQTITASIGLPPIVLWIVAGLIGLAALIFVGSNVYNWFSGNDGESIETVNTSYDPYTAADSVAVEVVDSAAVIMDTAVYVPK